MRLDFFPSRTLTLYLARTFITRILAVLVMLVPGLLAFVFGWFAFRARVNGVYLSIITQAMTYALMLAFFRNEMGFGGNNGLTDFKDLLGSDAAPERVIATVVRDFGVDKEREKVYGFKEMEAKRQAEAHRRRIIRERFSKEPFVDVAIELAGLMGFKVRTEGGSLFRLPTYIVERQGELVARFASGPELVQWVQESAAGEDAL